MKGATLGLSIVVLLAVLLPVPAAAQALKVVHVEGSAEYASGGGWKPLETGSAVFPETTVRVRGDSVLEISGSGTRLLIVRPGMYKVGDLAQAAQRSAKAGVGSLLLNRVKQMFTGRGADTPSAMAGVRGEVQDDGGGFSWIESTSRELTEEGAALLEAGNTDEAYDLFTDARLSAMDDEESAVAAFYLAGIHAMRSETVLALSFLDEESLAPEHRLYFDFMLLKAQLLLETFAYGEALGVLSGIDTGFAGKENLQLFGLLRAVALAETGDTEEARRELVRARELDPESEAGRSAGRLLAGL